MCPMQSADLDLLTNFSCITYLFIIVFFYVVLKKGLEGIIPQHHQPHSHIHSYIPHTWTHTSDTGTHTCCIPHMNLTSIQYTHCIHALQMHNPHTHKPYMHMHMPHRHGTYTDHIDTQHTCTHTHAIQTHTTQIHNIPHITHASQTYILHAHNLHEYTTHYTYATDVHTYCSTHLQAHTNTNTVDLHTYHIWTSKLHTHAHRQTQIHLHIYTQHRLSALIHTHTPYTTHSTCTYHAQYPHPTHKHHS